ncbi:MAG: RNA methyltransferase [Nesterenkonia sp.]|nr:RNA methyltransferase [Nesterenkonia sp.]
MRLPNPVLRLSEPDAAEDPLVADYRELTDAAMRRRRDAEHGMYMAESSRVVARALAAGHRPRSFFMTERHLPQLAEAVSAHPDAPVILGDDAVLESITGFHLHRGALAAMHRPVPPEPEALLDAARTLLVLEGITDHTNVGAIFRSAAALGVDGMLLSPTCADPLYRRSIRVSMGSVFTVPWARLPRDSSDGAWASGARSIREAGFLLGALEVADGAVALDDPTIRRAERVALILGAEGPGVTAGALASADVAVEIPMAGRAGRHEVSLDSLNVAAAAAVACWELGRRHA